MNDPKGPTPGLLAIPTTGRSISFSELTTPGEVWITNNDENNYVEYGIYEPATSTFYPWGEILPGKSCNFRFSRNLLEEYVGTGTSAPTNQVYMKANGGTVNVVIEAFEA